MMEKVVTRFAPSPTGFLHVGGVRTALYAYLYAKKYKGTFILRIEDTDKAREEEGSIEHIIESLKWLGIDWDEGPDIGGASAPYLQSDRLDIYRKYAEKLIEKGLAYPDPYSKEELEEFRKEAELAKKPFLYREHRPDNTETWDGTKPLRFKVSNIKDYKWNDAVYGELSAGVEALDDIILVKSDGYPTYNFAHIVDDIEMGVTHVMRGQEFISSTPKFLSIYEALGVEPPVFATLPPIMAPDGKKKLSKRDGAKDILEYKTEGYLPEAFINFLALLGWNPGDDREVFTKNELIEAFDISRIGNSGAKLNTEKLDWVNKQHIKKIPPQKLKEIIFEYLPIDLKIEDLAPIIGERISKWSDIATVLREDKYEFFNELGEYDEALLVFKNSTLEKAKENIKLAVGELMKIDSQDFKEEKIKQVLMELANKQEKRGELLHPVRFALSGLSRSPDPFIIAQILGKDETIKRLQKALA